MVKYKRRKITIPESMERVIEQLYAINTESYGTKFEDIPEERIVSMIENIVNRHYEEVIESLSKAINMLQDGGDIDMGAEKTIARLLKSSEEAHDVDARDIKFVALDRDLYDIIIKKLGYDESNIPNRYELDSEISTFIRLLMEVK